jgi:hypothetical protein
MMPVNGNSERRKHDVMSVEFSLNNLTAQGQARMGQSQPKSKSQRKMQGGGQVCLPTTLVFREGQIVSLHQACCDEASR